MTPSSYPTTLHRRRGVHAHRGTPPVAAPTATGHRRGRSRTAKFGEITATYLEHGPVRLDTPTLAWGCDPETLRLLIVVSGEVSLRHSEAAATLAPRDSALIMGTSMVSYASESDARVIICDLPIEQAGFAALPRSAPFVVGRADAALPCALGAFLLDLLRQDSDRLAPLARAQVADVLRTLATSAIGALAVAGGTGWEVRRQRMAALRHIAARYTDPALSSATVAEHLGLSRRSLQRLFEGEERTVAQRIQDVRTQHAINRLRDSRLATAALGEIATLSGFGSTVAMRRAVHEATGLTPTQLRRDAMISGTTGDGPALQDGVGDPDVTVAED
jgi:AraC-like DNA-binding protein